MQPLSDPDSARSAEQPASSRLGLLTRKLGRPTAGQQRAILWAVFAIYLVVRIAAWRQTVLVEDHGSISQMVRAQAFLTFDPRQIAALEPDTTPFYPFWVAVFSLPGWSVETGARVCSLAFSILLFFTLVRLGQRLTSTLGVVLGLLLVSFNPVLARLSYSILTEPSYVATVYLGLWLFWTQYERPVLWKAALLGVVFGLAFLNRTEGILFFAAIPLFQGAHLWLHRAPRYGLKQLLSWTVVFGVAFVLVAAPQVLWVSHRMGQFAINGREVWSTVLVQPDGRSYNEKIYGLDFSPQQINLTYLESHPEAATQFGASQGPAQYAHLVAKNFAELYADQAAALVGLMGILLFGAGLVALLQKRQQFEVILALGFIGVNLAGPLLHNVVIRHLAVVAPLILMIGGIGLASLWESIAVAGKASGLVWGVMLLILPMLLQVLLPQFRELYVRKVCNGEYCTNTVHATARVIRRIAARELHRAPVVATRKQYVTYYAGGRPLAVPYTDLAGLLRYLRANDANFLFLEPWHLKEYPFLSAFANGQPGQGLVLLQQTTDPLGRSSALYRVLHN